MARNHDLTALLPFPTRPRQRPTRLASQVNQKPQKPGKPQKPRVRDRNQPTSRSGPVQLDQLDLTEMVRHHAAASGRAAQRRNPRLSSGRVEHQGFAPGDDRAALQTRPDDVRLEETTRDTLDSPDGAVPSPSFYLDLIGAVTVMALVLLAAILV